MKHERRVKSMERQRCAWRPAHGPLPLVIDLDGGVFNSKPVGAILGAALRRAPRQAAPQVWSSRKRPDTAALMVSHSLSQFSVAMRLHSSMIDLMRVQTRFDGQICVISSARRETASALCRAIGIDSPVTLLTSERDQQLNRDLLGRRLSLLFGERGYVFAGPARGNTSAIASAQRAILLNSGSSEKRRFLSQGVPVTLAAEPDTWIETVITRDQLADQEPRNRARRSIARKIAEMPHPVTAPAARPAPVAVARTLARYT